MISPSSCRSARAGGARGQDQWRYDRTTYACSRKTRASNKCIPGRDSRPPRQKSGPTSTSTCGERRLELEPTGQRPCGGDMSCVSLVPPDADLLLGSRDLRVRVLPIVHASRKLDHCCCCESEAKEVRPKRCGQRGRKRRDQTDCEWGAQLRRNGTRFLFIRVSRSRAGGWMEAKDFTFE